MKALRGQSLWCVFALALVGATPVAHAQDTGSLIKPRPADIPDGAKNDKNLARQAMYSFAECALKRSRGSTLKYLDTFPNSDQANKAARSLAATDCLSDGMMMFNEAAFRGAVYEALYKQQFGRKEPASLVDAGHPDYAGGNTVLLANDQQTVAFRQFADCVARGQPGSVHALIGSAPGSAAETSAFGALNPAFSACLTNSVTLKFSKMSLRGVLGEVMYRIRTMPTQAAGVAN